MTAKQRLEWDAAQYKAQQEAKRGHNHPYLTDELQTDLERKGYKRYFFIKDETTRSEMAAEIVRDEHRRNGYYAKIVCKGNRLRIKTYMVYYKLKKS